MAPTERKTVITVIKTFSLQKGKEMTWRCWGERRKERSEEVWDGKKMVEFERRGSTSLSIMFHNMISCVCVCIFYTLSVLCMSHVYCPQTGLCLPLSCGVFTHLYICQWQHVFGRV